MPQQTPAQARVIDPILTNHAQGYRHPMHVWSTLFPAVPVATSGGKIIEFGAESFKLYSSVRAPGGATKRIDFGYQGKPYSCANHALEAKVPRELLREARQVPGIDLATRSVNGVLRTLSLELEYESSQLAVNAANYDANHKLALAGATKWSDPAGTPNDDIEAAKEAVRTTIGIRPNVVLLSALAFKAAKNNDQVVGRFKYTGRDSITAEMLANLWDVQRVVVGDAVYWDDTAGGFADVWGNNAVVAYVPTSSAGQEEPSYGYTYRLEGNPLVEEPYYDNNAKSWIYGIADERSPVLTGMAAGFLIQNPN